MHSLLTVLTRLNSYPCQLHTINAWFMVNSYVYYFKLLSHLTFFTHAADSLKLNAIRVYCKSINGAYILSLLIRFSIIVLTVALL